jgi:hypothetical protein
MNHKCFVTDGIFINYSLYLSQWDVPTKVYTDGLLLEKRSDVLQVLSMTGSFHNKSDEISQGARLIPN